MWQKLWTLGGVLGVVLCLVGMPAAAEPEPRVFEMEEISLLGPLDSPDLQSTTITPTAGYSACATAPQDEVKKYPALKSSRPLYGSVSFGQAPNDANSGIRFFFVVDESEGKEEQAPADGADRSSAKRTYDRLYFDANGDLDLTNDPVLKPMAEPGKLRSSSEEVVFDVLNLKFDEDAGLAKTPLAILPRLRVRSSTRAYASFALATARKGTVELGGDTYTALLTQPRVVSGRFDSPQTSLLLFPKAEATSGFRGLMSQQYLSAPRWVQGEFFVISATPEGDRLTVAPYAGDTGLLKLSPGGRKDVKKLGISGVLRCGDTLLRIGDITYLSQADKLPRHKIPVGDYEPASLSVDLGTLTAAFSQNYYGMEEPYARLKDPPPPSLKIRKDKPVVLDFSDKPVVQFTSPPKGKTVKPGDLVKIRARMVDPKMNLLIRGLRDTTQVDSERTYQISGRTVTIPRYASIAPTVTIVDPAGKQVAEGTMPFG